VILALSIAYLVCFQACAIPSIARIIRRGSSADLSVWREWLLVVGVTCQYMVMTLTGTSWYVRVSPILSLCSVGTLLWSIYRFRHRHLVPDVEDGMSMTHPARSGERQIESLD
jgi:hypothetical protein